ncbi:hypothetical protein SeMB42_g00750 [Synchytrium endobioticum]|uniref:Uncharacterized protein n=1 Tax=Synchytrium endobioticum TaxID=286115 RepID=A0A507DQ12_9FUNG|nr:hypothetical protein SeMB42_g00750 [Synchytrium endobioticum]
MLQKSSLWSMAKTSLVVLLLVTAVSGKTKKVPTDPITNTEYYAMLGVIAVLVLLGGVFSGLTIGLMSLDSTNMAILIRSGTEIEKRWVARIQPIRQNTHLLLVTLLLSNTIVNETLPVLFHYVDWDGYQAVLISTALIVVFGEIIPQAVCTRYSLAIGAFFAYPVRTLIVIMWIVAYPIARLLDWILGSKHGITYRRAELKELVAMHGEDQSGPLNADEVSILRAVLELRDKSVHNVMTTLEHVYMLPLEANLDKDTLKSLMQAGHSRIPVYNGERHNIVGVVLVKQLVMYDPAEAVRLAGIKIRRLPRVRVDTPLFELLHVFQAGGSHMAVVVEKVPRTSATLVTADASIIETSSPLIAAGSPQGLGVKRYRTLGIVTLEDVIEELLGTEIIDETDVFINMETGTKVRRSYREVKNRATNPMELNHVGLFGILTPRTNCDEEDREPLLRDAPITPINAEPNRIYEEVNRILTNKINHCSSSHAAERPRSRMNTGSSATGTSGITRNVKNKNKRDQVFYEAQRLAKHIEQHPFSIPQSAPHTVSTFFSESLNQKNNECDNNHPYDTGKADARTNTAAGMCDVNGIGAQKATHYGSFESDSSGLSYVSKNGKYTRIEESEDGFIIDGLPAVKEYSLDDVTCQTPIGATDMPDLKRIERELRQVHEDKACMVQVVPIGDNLTHLKGYFTGGKYEVDIRIPSEYPYKPPKMKFDTKIYHPNISSQTGAICLDILKDSWSPVITLKTALISLQSLLCDPQADDPQDAVVASQYKRDRAMFDVVARQWARQFAGSTAPPLAKAEDETLLGVDLAVLARIMEMGFDKATVVKALRKENNDEQRALEVVLSGSV